ncbi:CidA/LrgA family holin-like protein [Bacillus swezeyi]|uniref:Holin n=1 Tax=Bacillus swezeyi TaxID=1925020 RepID=A0A1R1S1C8_9BACI|nr:CidA/LrgA family holin-like protein [Bacillus swezeyi]MEC1259150.1 CidA/LrgA family holin-like protein [Bacillus swezeyi]MED1740475.1 CidA/LrgA family holin-like protein [Bacillus swezeyi]MED2927889.1 CidA/LrgA family holin-like protein [Bacillus swezeyi]MED2965199.1 CidA/LrgA family holin-like protein [Bacillus swezeyi]MED3071460.1 CidA/LrgA family holin-like protein [Bacillus swezeyi]
MKTFIKGIGQVALLFIFARLMNLLVEVLHIKIPGSIIGIIVIFALLHFKVIKLEWIEIGALWLLAELLLFFVPSAVGIMNYGELLKEFGTSIILVVLLSTFVVMVSTGMLTQMIANRKERKKTCSSDA